MKRPAPQLDRVYEAILEQQRAGKPFPSYVSIAERMGWRKSSARDAVNRLCVQGRVLWKARDPKRCDFRLNQG